MSVVGKAERRDTKTKKRSHSYAVSAQNLEIVGTTPHRRGASLNKKRRRNFCAARSILEVPAYLHPIANLITFLADAEKSQSRSSILGGCEPLVEFW